MRSRSWWLIACGALLMAGAGCSSKAKEQEKAAKQKAFIAGQEQAWRQYQQANPNAIRVNGPVANPILQYRPGLTLIVAIVEAGYAMPGNPGTIVVLRGTEQASFTAAGLLAGEDIELLPGDQIFLRP